jgi:hypothetical protein
MRRRASVGLDVERCRAVRSAVLESRGRVQGLVACDACAQRFPRDIMDVDHVIPFSVGGHDALSGGDNFFVLDANCHRLKTALERSVLHRIHALPLSAAQCWTCERTFSLYFEFKSHLFCPSCTQAEPIGVLLERVRDRTLAALREHMGVPRTVELDCSSPAF